MKFSIGNSIYSNNVSNSYKWLYFKNAYIMNYICIKFIFEILTFNGISYFYDMLKWGGELQVMLTGGYEVTWGCGEKH